MDAISVPILFALSAMSIMAVFAISAAAFVSPSMDLIKAAENDVTFCMYSLALIPAVLYAFDAYPLTTSALSLNSVSMPPRDCCNLPPSSRESLMTFPTAAATPNPARPLSIFFPNAFPALSPAGSISAPRSFEILACEPFIFGMIVTVA